MIYPIIVGTVCDESEDVVEFVGNASRFKDVVDTNGEEELIYPSCCEKIFMSVRVKQKEREVPSEFQILK